MPTPIFSRSAGTPKAIGHFGRKRLLLLSALLLLVGGIGFAHYAEAGATQFRLFATNGAQASSVYFSFSTDADTYQPGQIITVTLNIHSDDSPQGDGCTSVYLSTNGSSYTANLAGCYPIGSFPSGLTYTYTIAAPSSPGSFNLSISTRLDGYSVPAVQSIPLTVAAPTAPTVSISANPVSFTQGGSTTLSWTTTNATSCTASGDWSGSKAVPNGTQVVTPASSGIFNYTLTCTGLGGSTQNTANVTVVGNPCYATTISNCSLPLTPSGGSGGSCASGYTQGSCNYTCTNSTWYINFNSCALPAPATTFSASPNPVAYNTASTLTWSSTGATSCTAGGPWSNTNPPTGNSLNGSGLTNPLTAPTTFTFQCTGPGGTSPLQSVTVNVNPAPTCANGANNYPTCNTCTAPLAWNGSSCVTPSCSVTTASPSAVNIGDTITLNWNCNTSSCQAITNSDGFTTGGSPNSTGTAIPTANDVPSVKYGMTCGGKTFYFNPVTVYAPSAAINATPTRVKTGGSTTISWSSTDVKSCSVTKNGVAWMTGLYNLGVPDTNITRQTVYVITCTPKVGNNQVPPSTAIVDIAPVFQEF